jgi:NAD(P)-dependent dehydrogenase (short-subunit alcohol dehydrogenase family)
MKSFLVVGGTSGIGLELVKILSAQGHQMVVISRNGNAVENLPNVQHLSMDIRTEELPETALPDVLDGVAYCPGSINLKPFRSLKSDAFLDDFQINVLGAVKVLQASQKALQKAAEPSSVVLFSTVAVAQGMPYHASVAAAKGAVEGLTKSLAAEWAPSTRVNCIAPSLTDTPMAARLLNSDEKKSAAAARHPLRKIGKAEDIAALASFLLSSQSSWMTGQVIGLDGGLSSLRV